MSIFKWVSLGTAQILKISDRKGSIDAGMQADFVIWNPLSAVKLGIYQILENVCFLERNCLEKLLQLVIEEMLCIDMGLILTMLKIYL